MSIVEKINEIENFHKVCYNKSARKKFDEKGDKYGNIFYRTGNSRQLANIIANKINNAVTGAPLLIKEESDSEFFQISLIFWFAPYTHGECREFLKNGLKNAIIWLRKSCGKCVENCMLNNIKTDGGKPIWSNNCTHCMACICKCPTEAIEYGKNTKGKRRYFNNEL